MDKRKRNEATDYKKMDKIRDRGDLKKSNEKLLLRKVEEITKLNAKLAFPERGDSERKANNTNTDKHKSNVVAKKPTNDETRIKNAGENAHEKNTGIKKNSDNEQNVISEFDLRKRIREKYTLKLKSFNKNGPSYSENSSKEITKRIIEVPQVTEVVTYDEPENDNNDQSKNEEENKKQVTEETTQTSQSQASETSGKSNNQKQPVKNQRKPMIKTIMSKNGSVKIYKAVTFVDQRRPPTPLQINIPDSFKKPKGSKNHDFSPVKYKTKATVSRASVKDKPVAVRKKLDRKRDRKRRQPSPDLVSLRNCVSPPTEVARWAPSCIDKHTKPYYEAWVNTTLAALPKSSKKDQQYYEKQREMLLRRFQRVLDDRSRSPELFYENFADERYTGRIKITQK